MSGVSHGLNTDVSRGDRVYHVQTETVDRGGPAVETFVYAGGEILVRMTVSWADQAAHWGLTGDDVRHVVDLQHWDLVRKIRFGMLDEGDAPAASPPSHATGGAPEVDVGAAFPEECDPAVRELLEQLDARLSVPAPPVESPRVERPAPPVARAATAPSQRRRRWLPRVVVAVRRR